jgi:hypothetical protein
VGGMCEKMTEIIGICSECECKIYHHNSFNGVCDQCVIRVQGEAADRYNKQPRESEDNTAW